MVDNEQLQLEYQKVKKDLFAEVIDSKISDFMTLCAENNVDCTLFVSGISYALIQLYFNLEHKN